MVYVTGFAGAADFPVTTGAFLTTHPGSGCSTGCTLAGRLPSTFVAKLNPRGFGASSLIYSTFLGGSAGTTGNSVAVDSLGNAFVTGSTGFAYGHPPFFNNIPFPTTPGAYQTVPNFHDAFVTELNAAGNGLIYSTLLGGSGSFGTGIALDSLGNAHVTGYTGSNTFPTTPDAFQGYPGGGGGVGNNGFLTKFNNTGSALLYSSYLGGGVSDDTPLGIAVDPFGDAYVTGNTGSADFPTRFPFQALRGTDDAFVTKFGFGSQFMLAGVLPNHGGNTGTVTPAIIGAGFAPGATAKMVCPGHPEILGGSPTVAAAGNTLTTSFDLRASTPGACDLVITNSTGESLTSAGAFTIEQGGAPDVWIQIDGWNKLRGGRPQAYSMTYGNRGNVDAGLTRFWITFPSFLTWHPVEGQTPSSIGHANDNTFVAFDVPLVRAGSRSTIPVILSAPNGSDFAHRNFEVQVWKANSQAPDHQ
jgi:hypothetical protein